MASHRVSHVSKDQSGDITEIGVKDSWRLRSATAIERIEAGTEAYYVAWPEKSTWIRVVGDPKYLRTDRDDTTRNNLDELPSL